MGLEAGQDTGRPAARPDLATIPMAPFWGFVFSSEKWCKASEMPTPEIPISMRTVFLAVLQAQ